MKKIFLSFGFMLFVATMSFGQSIFINSADAVVILKEYANDLSQVTPEQPVNLETNPNPTSPSMDSFEPSITRGFADMYLKEVLDKGNSQEVFTQFFDQNYDQRIGTALYDRVKDSILSLVTKESN
jgi:hypothetical protein